jgi:thioredoxin
MPGRMDAADLALVQGMRDTRRTLVRWNAGPWPVVRSRLASFCIVKVRTVSEGDTQMAGILIEVTDTTFQAEVIESDVPVLVDFWAPWCGPCRVVGPILEEIAKERDDLRIVKLNTDENQQTAATFEILSIPTMILFRNGQVAKRIIGAYPRKRLEAELAPALA